MVPPAPESGEPSASRGPAPAWAGWRAPGGGGGGSEALLGLPVCEEPQGRRVLLRLPSQLRPVCLRPPPENNITVPVFFCGHQAFKRLDF
ncbi:unnamed protein product [Lepidochelys olivacea]